MDEASSSGSVSVDMEACSPWGGQEYMVPTSFGPISVQICGEQGKPALITYPDVGLNSASCFHGFFSCPEASTLLLHNFCVYHVDPPGHEQGAGRIPDEQPAPSVDTLTDQLAEVLDYFGLQEVIGLGVTAGAYILTHLALKRRERVLGLILVSPVCQAPSWSEWLYDKALVNLLYFWGMTNIVKEGLLHRYFGPEARASCGLMAAYRRLLDEGQCHNVVRFMQAIHLRKDLTPGLRKLKCRTLIIAGEQSPFHSEAHHISTSMDCRYNALIEVPACGSLVTEEQPHSMLVPIEYFLMGYGFFRLPQLAHSSPTSPLSPPCISSELLSPESLGLKLKPIKTRIATAEDFC